MTARQKARRPCGGQGGNRQPGRHGERSETGNETSEPHSGSIGTFMRASRTLRQIRGNAAARICCLGHYIPSFVRHAAHFGYDCIWLDLEHRNWPQRDVQAILAFAHLFDIDIMLRPGTLEKTALYRYLEDGATGLMIPHVNTPEMARELVQFVRFPPLGNRGLDGAGLDSDFMVCDEEDYLEEVNRQTFLVVQVETPEAVAGVDAIAAVEGVDGIFIGPGDLGLRLKYDPSGLTIDDAVEQVAAACRRHGKAWGMPVKSEDELRQRINQGGQLMAWGGEFSAIMEHLRQCAQGFDNSAPGRAE